MATLHLLAGRQGLTAEIASAVAWDAAARELHAALQLARQDDAARRRRERVVGIDHGRD